MHLREDAELLVRVRVGIAGVRLQLSQGDHLREAAVDGDFHGRSLMKFGELSR
jgi:hypothetical protein